MSDQSRRSDEPELKDAMHKDLEPPAEEAEDVKGGIRPRVEPPVSATSPPAP
jgi:hypothetical protein